MLRQHSRSGFFSSACHRPDWLSCLLSGTPPAIGMPGGSPAGRPPVALAPTPPSFPPTQSENWPSKGVQADAQTDGHRQAVQPNHYSVIHLRAGCARYTNVNTVDSAMEVVTPSASLVPQHSAKPITPPFC
ncbi:unnamed protein product [Protopolystoma xenopodis]|uniref:Uncharacterized protein n=1 Tax=Protopolystoma xenopodis TaxID=117903 RepID=A0A3S5FG39_9PLAT|nr:unnamed protein product [Protopolystoma xenopodis]